MQGRAARAAHARAPHAPAQKMRPSSEPGPRFPTSMDPAAAAALSQTAFLGILLLAVLSGYAIRRTRFQWATEVRPAGAGREGEPGCGGRLTTRATHQLAGLLTIPDAVRCTAHWRTPLARARQRRPLDSISYQPHEQIGEASQD